MLLFLVCICIKQQMIRLTHISIFINVGHILIAICGKPICGNCLYGMYNRFGSVHFAGAFHNTMWHKVCNGHICDAVRNVHRSFVGTFCWLRHVWRVTAGFPGRYSAASIWTAHTGSEQSRRIASVDRRCNWTRPGAATPRSRPADGRRSRGGI